MSPLTVRLHGWAQNSLNILRRYCRMPLAFFLYLVRTFFTQLAFTIMVCVPTRSSSSCSRMASHTPSAACLNARFGWKSASPTLCSDAQNRLCSTRTSWRSKASPPGLARLGPARLAPKDKGFDSHLKPSFFSSFQSICPATFALTATSTRSSSSFASRSQSSKCNGRMYSQYPCFASEASLRSCLTASFVSNTLFSSRIFALRTSCSSPALRSSRSAEALHFRSFSNCLFKCAAFFCSLATSVIALSFSSSNISSSFRYLSSSSFLSSRPFIWMSDFVWEIARYCASSSALLFLRRASSSSISLFFSSSSCACFRSASRRLRNFSSKSRRSVAAFSTHSTLTAPPRSALCVDRSVSSCCAEPSASKVRRSASSSHLTAPLSDGWLLRASSCFALSYASHSSSPPKRSTTVLARLPLGTRTWALGFCPPKSVASAAVGGSIPAGSLVTSSSGGHGIFS
mmetsp:Transcript_32290/g.67931  ORF Transcript_32290/g.67931 Transcript_32290/m.67931 type:complete len:458 (-) Transcript_32290:1293-2666(-)